jgi:lipopolysaccharide export system permease protein
MSDIVESDLHANQVVTKHYNTQNWQLTLNPQLLQISGVDPAEMTLKQLYAYISYLKTNNLNSNNEKLVLWQRLLQPLATLIMVWLAIPFVFGSIRNMSIGLRMMAGISLGFGFYLLNEFFGPLSIVYQWPPFLAAFFPIFLFALLAYLLQQRVK